MLRLGICISDSLHEKTLLDIHHQFNISIAVDESDFDYLLSLCDEKLFLHVPGARPETGIAVDFSHGIFLHRLKTLSYKQPLYRALGVSSSHKPVVYDMTAGLGTDAFCLAHLGCQVIAFEQNPAIAAILMDGIRRAKDHEALTSAAARIQLFLGDSMKLMDSFPHRGCTLYFDPMYPPRKKMALPKKELQFLHEIAHLSNDLELRGRLEAAIQSGAQRIVLKRPPKSPHIWRTPDCVFSSKLVRLDVYLGQMKS